MRRSIAMAVAMVVVALPMSACGADDSDPADDLKIGGPSASATASEPTASAAWSATAKPERPADQRTDAGAQEFTEFAARTVLYVMATGDAPALTDISDLSSCEDCRTWDDTYTSGKLEMLSIPASEPTFTAKGSPSVTDDVFYKVQLTMDIPQGEKVRRSNGEHVDDLEAAAGLPYAADLQWKDDAWVLMRYDFG